MNITDWIGFIGVNILLLAYFLNITDKIKNDSLIYLFLNFLGAGIACYASVLLNYLPFIVLEGSWTLVSVVGIFQYFRRK